MEDRVGFHLAGKQFNLPRKSASRGSAGWRGAGFPNGIASRTTLAHACFGGFGSHLWQRR